MLLGKSQTRQNGGKSVEIPKKNYESNILEKNLWGEVKNIELIT